MDAPLNGNKKKNTEDHPKTTRKSIEETKKNKSFHTDLSGHWPPGLRRFLALCCAVLSALRSGTPSPIRLRSPAPAPDVWERKANPKGNQKNQKNQKTTENNQKKYRGNKKKQKKPKGFIQIFPVPAPPHPGGQ